MAIFRYVEDSWVVDNDGETVATIPDGPQQGAKGRRCAAALNETWGISTEDLEAGAVARLVECQEALNWLVHLAHDVGKDGGRPHPDEWEAAFEAGKKALAPFDPD